MSSDFGKQIAALNRKYGQRQTAIFRESAQRVMENANIPEAKGGRMPVDTGFLRGSTAASTSGMPAAGSGPPELIFAKLELGQSVWVGWTAVYARRQEYGFMGTDSLGRSYNQRGKGFLRVQVQRWPQIVDEVTREVTARIQ